MLVSAFQAAQNYLSLENNKTLDFEKTMYIYIY